MSTPHALAIVPVRLGSARLPGKALLSDSGRPLFVHTVEAARAATKLRDVLVATDSEEVRNSCVEHGIGVLETSEKPRSGSERCAEALPQVPDAEIVIDVQGDWPEVHGADLDALVTALSEESTTIATLCCALDDAADFANPHVVKVVCRADGRALYFSRAPIPGGKAGLDGGDGWRLARRHIGIYGFRRATLAALHGSETTPLEQQEELEQLAWLQRGSDIRVLEAQGRPRGIETRSDYDAFVRRVAERTESKAGS